MRTKHILYSMVLGAALAACSSEEDFQVVNVNDASDAMLSIRPVVGTEFVMGSDDAATRLVMPDGGYAPEFGQNDKVGAAIIDVPIYTSESDYYGKLETQKAIALYNIVESYGCNNAFTTTNGKTWSAEHPMVEGNYLFYAPYQEGRSLRAPFQVSVPRTQDASTEKKALEDFYNGDNIVKVGYKFITGTETQKPVVDLYNIFAYPMFTIKNNFAGRLLNTGEVGDEGTVFNGGTITVDSIQFVEVSDKTAKTIANNVAVGGMLKHSDQATQPATSATAGVVGELHEKTNGFTADGTWVGLDGILNTATTADLLDGGSLKKRTDKVITSVKVGRAVAQNSSINVYCVMPSYRFDSSNEYLMAKVFVTINGASYEISKAVFSGNGNTVTSAASAGYVFDPAVSTGLKTLSLMAGQRYPAEALRVENGMYKLKADEKAQQLLTIDLSKMNCAVRTDAVDQLKTTDDLIKMIIEAANGTAWAEGADAVDGSTRGFKIAADNEIVINGDLVSAMALANQNGGSLTLETVVPIDANVKVKGVSGEIVTFENAAGESAKITLKDAKTDGTADGTEAAYIITDATYGVGSTVNAGSVIIANGNSWTVPTDAKVASLNVVEGNTFTLAGTNKLTVANGLRNDGTLTVNGTIDSKVVANYGTIKANAATANFTVTAGDGSIEMSMVCNGAKVAAGVAHDVIFVASDLDYDEDANSGAIANIRAVAAVNAIKLSAQNTTALSPDNWKLIPNVKKIILPASSGLKLGDGTFDMNGVTIVAEDNVEVEGSNVNLTKVNNVVLQVAASKTLTLDKIAATGTASGLGKISADGTNATWNGGASGQN